MPALLLQTYWSLQKSTNSIVLVLYLLGLEALVSVFKFVFFSFISLNQLSIIPSGQEEPHTTTVLIRPAAVERVLLYNCHQQPLLWQDGWQPHLCPDTLGPKPRGTGQVGRRTNGLSLDRCYYDPAETGGVDPSFGKARCCLFPHQGRPLDQLGRRHEGKNGEKREQVLTWG